MKIVRLFQTKRNAVKCKITLPGNNYKVRMACLLKLLRGNIFRGPIATTIRQTVLQENCKIPLVNNVSRIIGPWVIRKEHNFKSSLLNRNVINFPSGMFYLPQIESTDSAVEAPSHAKSDHTIQAARLIVIRRKKMKKHKLKKLRKKMKFEWAKVRQRRELRKEKKFQAILINQCKTAEAFSAEQYVQEKLDKLNEFIIPRLWKGKRLPEFIIREKLGLPPKK